MKNTQCLPVPLTHMGKVDGQEQDRQNVYTVIKFMSNKKDGYRQRNVRQFLQSA